MKRGTAELIVKAAMIVAEKQTGVFILYQPISPIRKIITKVLKKLRIPYEYAGRGTMQHYGMSRGSDDPRFFVEIDEKQYKKIEEMIRQEQDREGWEPGSGWEFYF